MLRKKSAFTPRYFVSVNEREVWLSGRKRHTANVLDSLGPGGSNPSASAVNGSLAQLDQSVTLRTSRPGVRISHESQTLPMEQGNSSYGEETEASPNPLGQGMELWQTGCMRRTENPENVVRLHEVPLIFGSAPAATRADCKSAV